MNKNLKQALIVVAIIVGWWFAGPFIEAIGLATPVSILILVVLLALGALYTGLYGSALALFRRLRGK